MDARPSDSRRQSDSGAELDPTEAMSFFGAATEPGGELDIGSLIAIARKRAALIVAIVAVMTAIAAVRTFSQTPVFAAAAVVHLSKEPPDPTTAKFMIAYEGLAEEYLNTQMKIVRSRAVAAIAIERDQVVARDLRGIDDAAGAFQGGITVRPIPSSYLVEIGYEHEDPSRVARYANAVADAYVAYVASDREAKTRTAEKNLAAQIPILQKDLADSEAKLQSFLDDGGYPGFERQQDLAVERLKTLSEALGVIQRDRVKKQADVEAINMLIRENLPLESAPSVVASPFVRDMRVQLGQIELERAQLAEKYGERWPRLVQLEERRKELQLKIRFEIEQIRAELQSALVARASEEAQTQRQVDVAREEARRLEQQAQIFKNYHSRVEADRRLYEEFSQRYKEVTAYSQVDVGTVRILDAARPPGAPIRPNRTRDIMLGAMLGLAIAIAISVLLEFIDERLRTPRDIATHLKLPVLAIVPEVDDVPEIERERLAIVQPASGFAEAFRRLRAQVEAKVTAAPGRGTTFLVTSAGVGEGKTLTSLNLAIAMANAGARVAIVDADMRNPRIHRVLGVSLAPGLAEVLEGRAASPSLREHLPNLFVLSAGKPSRNPAELLAAGGSFERVLEVLRLGYDRVVLDAPPCAALSDPSLLAPYADGVLFVVSSGETFRRAALLGRSTLQGVGVQPLGVVLNNVPESDLVGLFGYGYGYYHVRDGEREHARAHEEEPEAVEES